MLANRVLLPFNKILFDDIFISQYKIEANEILEVLNGDRSEIYNWHYNKELGILNVTGNENIIYVKINID